MKKKQKKSFSTTKIYLSEVKFLLRGKHFRLNLSESLFLDIYPPLLFIYLLCKSFADFILRFFVVGFFVLNETNAWVFFLSLFVRPKTKLVLIKLIKAALIFLPFYPTLNTIR